MSFKLFVYYCAVAGGWAAFVAWFFGRQLAPEAGLARAVVQGLILGLLVALSVGVVDALWNLSSRQTSQVVVRVLAPVAVGCVGGIVGPFIAQLLVKFLPRLEGGWVILGWTLTGLAVGASVGAYELFARLQRGEGKSGALRKIRNGLLGGALGGLLGGTLLQLLKLGFGTDKDLLTPSATGFVALGLSIGLLIAMVQVILKEAWVRVEAGFRAGRELLLSKPETTIGRAEASDIGLFGDHDIERTHARILLQGGRYVLADAGSAGGTFINEEKVTEPTPLRTGDAIRVGHSVLRFGERRKRPTG
jgi:hypothetical protein